MHNKRRSTKILKWAKKLKFVKELGSKCQFCGCDDLRCLQFHHTDDNKEKQISSMFQSRLDNIIDEVKKCILLCSRCHSVFHHSNEIKEEKRRKNKNIFLEYKEIDKCEKCGWGEHPSGLDFHHPNDDKLFSLSQINKRFNSIADIDEYVKSEIDKCVLLCKNCHNIEHYNESFSDIELEIQNKTIKNYKKTDHKKVKEMYYSGISRKNICKELGITKSLVSYILNKRD